VYLKKKTKTEKENKKKKKVRIHIKLHEASGSDTFGYFNLANRQSGVLGK